MLLSIKDAAQFLGISKRSMERLREKDEIESVSLPGIRRVLFRSEDLERFAKENRTVPLSVPHGRHIVAVSGGSRRRV